MYEVWDSPEGVFTTLLGIFPSVDSSTRSKKPFGGSGGCDLPEDLVRGLPKPEKPDENVLLGILVREERLPTLVGKVVAADELDLKEREGRGKGSSFRNHSKTTSK